MTPNSPDEAIHFRGKTLTPESPRPLHIPEPSNIPVLENQMDPIFNDTSTYEKPASNRSEEQLSQLNSEHAIYQSVDDSQSRIEETSHSLASDSELANLPIINSQSTAVDPASSTEHNVGPYHQTAVPTNADSTKGGPIPQQQVSSNGENVKAEAGVDFQNLLDNLSTAPPAPAVTATASSPSNNAVLQEHEQPPHPSISNNTYAGLPPRPPAQEVPDLSSNYTSPEENSDYHRLFSQAPNSSAYVSQPQGEDQYSNATAFAPGVPPGTSSGANGLPPPPVATFQQHQTQQKLDLSPDNIAQVSHKGSRTDKYGARPGNVADDEAPWGPEVQKIYDEFLREERIYVTEGLWDRFPHGSRLFVGNLPTERVTKRDLFHVFHKYGKLAQISIKQAYGFIQFLDANSCHQALQAEQGGVVRGRKIHLEISKPQKNTRPGPGHSESARAPLPRRSRSPADTFRGGASHSRGMRNQGGDRHDRAYDGKRGNFSDFRDEHNPRRRDDYRPPRSPSPRPFRNREGGFRSRDRTPERFERRDRRRSRSPYGRDRRFRSPSPRGRSGYDGETELAFSRRTPRDVPDLQILAADDVEMSFVYHVENSFKTRGLRTNVLVLSRIPVDVAIQRQMEEGVSAVIKLTRSQQFSGKVTLVVFDRSVGAGNKPRSIEYPDLDLHVAVEMTVQFQSVRRAGVTQNYYPSNQTFPIPGQYPQAIPHAQPAIPALPQTNQIANFISTLDGPGLQSLLSTLQQAQSVPQAVQPPIPVAPNATNPVDLASLLNNAHRQQNPLATAQNQGPLPHAIANPFGLPLPAQVSSRPDPNLLALLAKGAGNANPPQGQTQHVQNIVNQLAKWKQ
ncbi:hypothetical protein UA08_05555 [Talaromyces atroroseus]|uniref:RRM domain-containing protein n=1 Tax=Talaromyces atroroseus TaxID=1441469 RepID=A0A225ACC2_TALAT|nr:hypothetical protein UA08_05555 [Talaromyces atroroseus]OKL58771.1 hypothetical protein UA08_05555 [Talaromyces atroroseus]